MMRSLYVLRHGKSDWPAGGRDHERPLKQRGRDAARRMGRVLTLNEQAPDLVLSSSAERARRTAELAREAGEWDAPLEVRSELYEATPGEVVAVVHEAGPEVRRVLVVGHQPTCGALVAILTGGADPSFPTAALARIDFEGATWSCVEPGRGRLAWLVTPKLLAPLVEP